MSDGSRTCRVFICYSHNDADLLKRVVKRLKQLGHIPRCSGTLRAGARFAPEIREEIRRAHLFMPLLTKESQRRSWVNQEIGYALACNVPILPLAFDKLPEGFAHELQAVRVRKSRDLGKVLTNDEIESAITFTSRQGGAIYEVAPLVEDRSRMLYSAAESLSDRKQNAKVRQWGTFTSFSLPDADYDDRRWPRCDGGDKDSNRGLRRDWRRERQALEHLARTAGCDLLIDPYVLDLRSRRMKRTRAKVLLDFLKDVKNDRKIRAVVIPPPRPGERPRPRGNLTLLGDCFAADSVTPLPGLGFERTLGTWHASTVLERVRDFDRLFKQHRLKARKRGKRSTQIAIERLKKFLAQL